MNQQSCESAVKKQRVVFVSLQNKVICPCGERCVYKYMFLKLSFKTAQDSSD